MHTAYLFKAVAVDDAAIEADAALLRQAFPGSSLFTREYLRWQYARNPAGTIVGFDAIDPQTGEAAAHYVCQPFDAQMHGKPLRGLLSLNTATHPLHQGRGLFTELANRTYESARAAGFDFVIGVANANSTPGFVRKLGFALVCPLYAMLGAGALRVREDAEPAAYRRVWSDAALKWRLENPHSRYSVRGGEVWAPTGRPFVDALIGRFPALRDSQAAFRSAPLHLWIGCDPRVVRGRNPLYVNLPQRLRPSPLNLIYKNLRDPSHRLDAREVEFWAIDFDAY